MNPVPFILVTDQGKKIGVREDGSPPRHFANGAWPHGDRLAKANDRRRLASCARGLSLVRGRLDTVSSAAEVVMTRSATRREFLSGAASMGAAGLVSNKVWAAPVSGFTYGVQMFMLREQAKTDLPGVFKAIHDAGFAQVEFYPIAYSQPAAKLRELVHNAGLQPSVSGHFDYVSLKEKLDYAHELGLKYMVCPAIPNEQRTVEGFRAAAEFFNKIGKSARDRGMQFAFHNHDYEFAPMDGTVGFDVLMEHSDPTLVKLQLDCYWLTQAGQDPLQMLKKHASRAVLLHLKDRTPAPAGPGLKDREHFTELGKGTINWPAILEQGHKQGIKYAFLDQDGTSIPVPESMRESRAYLRSI